MIVWIMKNGCWETIFWKGDELELVRGAMKWVGELEGGWECHEKASKRVGTEKRMLYVH